MSDLIFANSRAKVHEAALMNAEKFNRMLDSDLADAVKVLSEAGYEDCTVENYDDAIRAEEKKLSAFMKELKLDEPFLNCLMSHNDFHNAKALMKAKYMRLESYSDMLLPEGRISLDTLKDGVMNDDYRFLPESLAEALRSVDEAFATGNRSPRLIDVTVDRAMFGYFFTVLKDEGAEYYRLKVFFVNLVSFIRCKALNLSYRFFEEQYIDGDGMKNRFLSAYEAGVDALAEKVKGSGYSSYVAFALENEISVVETYADNKLLNLLKERKNDMFSVYPVAGYYVAKQYELKMVRLILTGLKNKVDKSVIRQRLRDTYEQ